MNQPYLASEAMLTKGINDYFIYLEGEYHLENKPGKGGKDQPVPTHKVWDRDPQPTTFTGLAYYLGFYSQQEFENYTVSGEFSNTLKRARLRVEVSYECKLHKQSSAGAIFALKNNGWNERTETKQQPEERQTKLDINITTTGPQPAQTEKDVVL